MFNTIVKKLKSRRRSGSSSCGSVNEVSKSISSFETSSSVADLVMPSSPLSFETVLKLKEEENPPADCHFTDQFQLHWLKNTSCSNLCIQSRSRLISTLFEVLQNISALPYFYLFMHSIQKSQLLKFLAETDAFYTLYCQIETNKNSFPAEMEKMAVSIFTKYMTKDSPFWINLPDELQIEQINLICTADNNVNVKCFVSSQLFVYHHIQQTIFPNFLKSSFYAKYCLEFLSKNFLQVDDVLYNEDLSFYFTEFMVQEEKQTLLELLFAIESSMSSADAAGNFDRMLITSDAKTIYKKYFSEDVPGCITLPNELRCQVECMMDSPNSAADLFNILSKHAYNSLANRYLPGFFHSRLYARYLNDLVLKSRLPDSTLNNRSISLEQLNFNKRVEFQNCDAPQSEHSLFTSRSKILFSRLGIAHVDQFGRYVRDIADIPKVSSDSRIKGFRLPKVIPKLMNKEPSKEAILEAEQIAASIVQDVQSMTLDRSQANDEC
ncbi:A-kinase anchor protein 10, mitochondrial [Trichinella sp. T8]|uniref:A-kinase anchor protein 10, mitochondrial n=1 Tax=Trichinella murrelli TaxID=144512 RepID=A0A0V0TWE6_9BILA|nr:A-kinase anchor protein 10, mitochondrial [Trichinella murrelli]KRZ83572.1 A-kinase anchor protein 10, mitochondrial [Trichinella sp. T8]